jgi:hypothetical protein
MKKEKKRAKNIKSKIEKLLVMILQITKASEVDVLDLMGVLKYGHGTMEAFLGLRKKTRPKIADDCEILEIQFTTLELFVYNAIKSNKFLTMFASWQLRTKIDLYITNFFVVMRTVHEATLKKRFISYNLNF